MICKSCYLVTANVIYDSIERTSKFFIKIRRTLIHFNNCVLPGYGIVFFNQLVIVEYDTIQYYKIIFIVYENSVIFKFILMEVFVFKATLVPKLKISIK